MVDYKFIFILYFMKTVYFFQMKILWIRYENWYDENFPYFIDILP